MILDKFSIFQSMGESKKAIYRYAFVCGLKKHKTEQFKNVLFIFHIKTH